MAYAKEKFQWAEDYKKGLLQIILNGKDIKKLSVFLAWVNYSFD